MFGKNVTGLAVLQFCKKVCVLSATYNELDKNFLNEFFGINGNQLLVF